jgi:beta-lactamase class A
MQAILGQAGGDFGVVVYDVQYHTLVYTQQQDLSFSAASLIKLPIAVAVYQLASAEALSLDTPLVMQAEDIVGGSGSLQYEPAGTAYTIRELCARMISDSDNTAANMLVEYIGGFAVVNGTMQQIGTTNTSMQRYLMDLEAMQAGRDNLTSPADMQLLLRLLAQDELAGAGELRAALEQTSDTQKLPARLPANVIVQHKIGTLTGVEHDVGIVYPPSSSHYIAVFMSNGLSSNQAGITAIAEASRLVYDYFTESVAAGDGGGDALGETAAMPSPMPSAPPRYVFPVDAEQATYGPYHHDYPATDIFCPIGSPYLATTSGVVDFVNASDRWDPTTDVPADRGGIMVAIIGDDGWRYYGSHLSGIAAGIVPGVRVDAGQLLGWTGNSGNARWTDPHLHYGISYPTFPEDWQTRRGEIPPYSYLQAWQRGEPITPQDDGEEG